MHKIIKSNDLCSSNAVVQVPPGTHTAKGIPLPFISAGGTSMLLTSAAVGVLLNVARYSDRMKFCLNEDVPVTHELFGYRHESA